MNHPEDSITVRRKSTSTN